jgi:hypothetical protein
LDLLIKLSLGLNIAVLTPVCASLVGNAGWTLAAYGPPSPARGILLSIYLAILIVSLCLMFRPIPAMVAALLIVQIAYKVTTPFTVGTFGNPVVLSNLAIAAFHMLTVSAIYAHGKL